MPNSPLLSVEFQPMGKRLLVSPGTSLLEAARRAGIRLSSTCGGQADCGQCVITVLEGQVSGVAQEEEEQLSPAQLEQGQRLACYTRFSSAVCVFVPQSSLEIRLEPRFGDEF